MGHNAVEVSKNTFLCERWRCTWSQYSKQIVEEISLGGSAVVLESHLSKSAEVARREYQTRLASISHLHDLLGKSIRSCRILPHDTKILQNFWLALVQTHWIVFDEHNTPLVKSIDNSFNQILHSTVRLSVHQEPNSIRTQINATLFDVTENIRLFDLLLWHISNSSLFLFCRRPKNKGKVSVGVGKRLELQECKIGKVPLVNEGRNVSVGAVVYFSRMKSYSGMPEEEQNVNFKGSIISR